MDFRQLVAEVVRERRGARTQKALSRSLGYRSNVVFAWENGHDEPSARNFFRLVEKTGPPPALTLWLRGELTRPLTTRDGVTELLQKLLGHRKLADVARELAVDRHAAGRWLRGQSDIKMADLLRFIEWTSLSLYDFLSSFVDPARLPEAQDEYRALLAARTAAKTMPWAHAIVHMVDLPSYSQCEKHEAGWFASRLGLSLQEEAQCLAHLVESGQLTYRQERYFATDRLNVDTRQDPQATRQLASFWMREAAERVLTPGKGSFAFNTFAISLGDLDALRELQSEYYRRLRALVAESEPTQAVAVATLALMPLCVEPPNAEHPPVEPPPTAGTARARVNSPSAAPSATPNQSRAVNKLDGKRGNTAA